MNINDRKMLRELVTELEERQQKVEELRGDLEERDAHLEDTGLGDSPTAEAIREDISNLYDAESTFQELIDGIEGAL